MRHIYVHVPFCARRCSYCDFSIAVRKTIPADEFLAAIEAELSLRREQGEWDESPTETLYFGGGTPSLLPPGHIAQLIESLQTTKDQRPKTQDLRQSEITLEANPDDVTPAKAAAWRAAGVNRISLGAQSFKPEVLQWMHRTHDVTATTSAVEALRDAGIDNISLDLIFALPRELGSVFEQDLTQALALQPRHLSIYGLSVEARTPLSRWIDRGASSAPGEDRYAEDFLLADRALGNAGFEHYEVSNYALPGHESRHNSAYWRDQPYSGLGPAAHSFSGGERRWNAPAWAAYERTVREGMDPTVERERLTDTQARLERLYLDLRTSRGTSLQSIPSARAANLTDQGWLRLDGDRYRLTPEGWLRLDEIVAVLTT